MENSNKFKFYFLLVCEGFSGIFTKSLTDAIQILGENINDDC